MTSRYEPVETHRLEIRQDEPVDFQLRFVSGCNVGGSLQELGHIHIDGVDSLGVFADMRFCAPRSADIHFEGLMVTCPSHGRPHPHPRPHPRPNPHPHPRPTPPSPHQPDDPSADDPSPMLAGPMDELFPYVYVRRWPRVSDDDSKYGFAAYVGPSPPSAFVSDLTQARTAGRDKAQALAITFIDGDAPYAGDFVGDFHQITGPVREFPRIAERLRGRRSDPYEWMEEVRSTLHALLERYHEPADYFTSAVYAGLIDRIWQSYFALVVLLGYDEAHTADLCRSLWLAHLIALVPVPDAPPLEARQIIRLANANVTLLEAIFPLPPGEPDPGASPPETSGWIEPYAIGDLQMVRHRLRRYALGDIARIENVLRGERRETASRRLRREEDYQQQHDSETRSLDNDESETRSSFLEEARRAAAEAKVAYDYTDLKTTYGLPTTANLAGGWTRTDSQAGKPGAEDATRFAREVLSKTAGRMARKVGAIRASGVLSQAEDTVSSVIDNSAGEGDLRAVYRWVNKIYEACVVNYGNRLMIEFLVSNPSADFIAQQAVKRGRQLAEPMSPQQKFSVSSFQDIAATNYADICAFYGVTDLKPPPAPQAFVTAAIRGGEERQLAIPPGYVAVEAFATSLASSPSLASAAILVGRTLVTPGAAAATLPAYGEDATIPVSVLGAPLPALPAVLIASPPVEPIGPEAQLMVNVEVRCEASARIQDEWRIGIYAAVTRAYQEQSARYYADVGRSGTTGPTRSPLACRQIERRALKTACSKLLLERMDRLVGAPPPASPPTPRQFAEPRYLQFLEQALEWPEMAYSFQSGARCDFGGLDGGDDDALFAGFLQADQARVLLPVRPGRLLAFLYFFSSGAVWDGPDELAPVEAQDIPVVNDLKHAEHARGPHGVVGRSWEMVVPTTMQVVSDGEWDEFGAPGFAENA